jgi:hypothetical protein
MYRASERTLLLKATTEMTMGAFAGDFEVNISSSGNDVFITVSLSTLALKDAKYAPFAVRLAWTSGLQG